MAPKITCNPTKLQKVIAYFQKSRVAHNIKDLEKHLPSVASINGMQVKEYLQALQDDNKINVEKIGSGNWYWSFPSEDKKCYQKDLDTARTAFDKANAINEELKTKIAHTAAERANEQDMLDEVGGSRQELSSCKLALEAEVKAVQKELSAYSDSDPTEIEKKRKDIAGLRAETDALTDDIYSMENWFSQRGLREMLAQLQETFYGDELDSEEGVLRELW